MPAMLDVLRVTFPFFALVLCGYLAARRRFLPLEAIPGLNGFVLYFALPCMLFRFGASTPIAQIPPAQLAEAFGRTVRSALSVAQVVEEETWILGLNVETSSSSVLKFELTRFDWSSPYPTNENEVGVNWLLRTALNVTF